MTKIKGPIKMVGGFNANAFLQAKLGDLTTIKLPFKATGWKSTKNPAIIKDNNEIAELVETKQSEVKEIVSDKKPDVIKSKTIDKARKLIQKVKRGKK